jgi:hypothetical protein
MNCLAYCEAKYYLQDNSEFILTQVQDKLSKDITAISHEMLCIFYDAINKEPSCYWNRTVYQQTYTKLEEIFSLHATSINLNEEIMEHFLIGYHTYRQITDIMNDLSKLNDNPEIKNRLYRIPTYVSIVEGCLTNLFRVITLILDQTSQKDFASAKKLNPLCEILKSNGFDMLVSDVNVNIRNAINHGGIIFKENGIKMDFQYTENRQSVICTMNTYEFDTLINKVYDTASGVLLGICSFINNHMALITVDKSQKLFIPFCLLAMELSIPGIRFRSISGLPDSKQLNVDIEIQNSDRTYIGQIATLISIMVFEKYSDYQQYMFFFSNERLQGSWVRFSNQEIKDMTNKIRPFDDVMKGVIERGDCIIFDASIEPIDMQEIKYYRYPNRTEKEYKISNVEDASLPDRKRLKAHLFIGDIPEKEKILEIIRGSVDWLKTVRNVPSPTLPHKYGTMDADALYINVYKNDARGNKELFPNNDNFVCFVDYNIDGKTTLEHGGLPISIWHQLHHESLGNIQIAWREGKYLIRKAIKTGRNDPCPCGSGKKYKKCCSS